MNVSRGWIAIGSGLLAAAWILGCAAKGPTPEEELEFRKAESHRALGIDHLMKGRPELALRELLLADRLNPSHPRTNHALAEAYMAKARTVEAEAHLLSALATDPDFHEARFDLSTFYIWEGRFADSLPHSQQLLDDPTFTAPWTAHNNYGLAQLELGNQSEARRHLEKAREYNDRYWPTLLNLGILESREGHQLEAIESFQSMLELKPKPSAGAEANYRLAEIYVSLGKRERALGHLKAAVARDPGEEWGKKSEEYLKLLR